MLYLVSILEYCCIYVWLIKLIILLAELWKILVIYNFNDCMKNMVVIEKKKKEIKILASVVIPLRDSYSLKDRSLR